MSDLPTKVGDFPQHAGKPAAGLMRLVDAVDELVSVAERGAAHLSRTDEFGWIGEPDVGVRDDVHGVVVPARLAESVGGAPAAVVVPPEAVAEATPRGET